MKARGAIALLFFFTITCCSSGPGHSLLSKGIAIQPIVFDDPSRLAFIQHEISAFYHCPVYILGETPMPASFINLSKGERYSADSILRWLAHRRDDDVAILLGLTGKDIYIADKDAFGRIKEPAGKYEHLLRAIVIHEIGHNLGLPHCKVAQTLH